MPDEWFYIKEKKKLGPVSFAQLKDMVGRGQLNRTDMVLQGGTSKWAAAEAVGLFPGMGDDFPIAAPPIVVPAEPPPDLEVFAQATEQRMKPHQGDMILILGIASIAAGVIGLP